MGAVTHCHSAVARAKSLLGMVRVPRPGGLRGDTEETGMLEIWEHAEPGDTESTGTPSTGDTRRRTGMCKGAQSLGTPSTEGHRLCRDTDYAGTQDSTPSCSLGAELEQGKAGGDNTGDSHWWQQRSPWAPVSGAGRAALSQAVSPDPLNHWKIRQGSGTGNIWAPGGHPAPLGLPGSTGKWGRMWESQPGLSCSRVVAQGQQGPHEEPKWQEMLSAHLSPRSGEVRRALWCHRMHLHPGNRLGSPHVGRRRR